MPVYGRFMVYSVLGSLLWDGGFIVLGWILGAQWMIVEQYASIIEHVVLANIGGSILWFVLRRRKAHE